MNQTFKRYAVSALTTFVSVFLTTAGAQLAIMGTIQMDYAAMLGLLMIAARAATKAVVEAVPSFGSADK